MGKYSVSEEIRSLKPKGDNRQEDKEQLLCILSLAKEGREDWQVEDLSWKPARQDSSGRRLLPEHGKHRPCLQDDMLRLWGISSCIRFSQG